VVIDQAAATDLAAVRRLLEAQGLPLDGIDQLVATMIVARDGDEVVGAAAVEMYADGALLRSVVVSPAVQRHGIGHQLTDAALTVARSRGADTVFLLTTTAEGFFPKFGFERIARAEVPASVQASVEFQSACPASATVMRKRFADAVGASDAADREMKTVLFACVHNAGRSQMAAAWFNRLADSSKARAISAGSDPAPRVHPEVIAAMREVGIELAAAPTTRLTPAVASQAQIIVTMGCGDRCPHVPGAKREDWSLDDPKDKPLEKVREIRDAVHHQVRALVEREGWSRHR
jgi:arsenate reductase